MRAWTAYRRTSIVLVIALPSRRFAPPVERAAYLAVLAALESACGDSLEVRIRESDGLLRVAVGPTAPGELSVLRDRVLALGGSGTLDDRVLHRARCRTRRREEARRSLPVHAHAGNRLAG